MKRIIILSASLLFFFSCKKNEDTNILTDESTTESKVYTFNLEDGSTIVYERVNGENIMDGDIILTDEQVGYSFSPSIKTTSAPGIFAGRWTNSTVNYKISYTAKKSNIDAAIQHIEQNTNIKFVASASGNYIDFIQSAESNVSYSALGMTGGRQTIRLGSNSGLSTTIHEIGHALGLYHEQSRTDRDQHITIHWNRIKSGRESQFETKTVQNHGPFDFLSVMMYYPCSFSNDNSYPCTASKATITRKDGTLYSEGDEFSTGDFNALNDMYPNKINKKSGIIDIGANANGDIVYSKKNRFYIDIYKNNTLVERIRTTSGMNVDVTSTGSVLKSGGTFRSGVGKYATYTIRDIAEGGGKIYCIASNTKTTGIYRKSGSSWVLEYTLSGAKRISVDGNGNPWITTNSYLYRKNNGSYSRTSKPQGYTSTFWVFNDVGASGNDVFVSMDNLKNSNAPVFRYSFIANFLIRQPGSANFLDAGKNDEFWTN